MTQETGGVLERWHARLHAAHAAGRDVLGWFGSAAEVGELLRALNDCGSGAIGQAPTRSMGAGEAPRYLGTYSGVTIWEVSGGAFMLGEVHRDPPTAPSIGELDARAVARAVDEAHSLAVAREMLAGGDLDALDRFLAEQIERRAGR